MNEIKIMKSTGIVRKIDQLGRLVLPIELRRTLNLPHGTPMELFVSEDKIIIKKYEPSNRDDLINELDEIVSRSFNREDKKRLNELLDELLK